MSDRNAEPDTGMPRIRPAVQAAKQRTRVGFVIALAAVLGAAAVVLVLRVMPRDESSLHTAHAPTEWWQHAAGKCTPLGVATAVRDARWSEAQRATCLAVAGKVSEARERLLAMPVDQRADAVQLLFDIAHPIADAGDDLSSGPIMRLVVELWPENFMALFHAGMADYATGEDSRAREHLERFLQIYQRGDVWTRRAEAALAGIVAQRPLSEREAHFPH